MRRLVVTALALFACASAPAAAAPSAHVWLTTVDRSMQLTDRGSTDFAPGGSGELTVTVDPSRAYQRMDGFGASITDSSAHVLYRLDSPHRAAAMRALFATDNLPFLRQPMGASDFVAGPHYTYDHMPAGETDYGMHHFSVQHDRRQI